MLSLFDLFGESTAAAQPKPNTGKRPYTDKMPDWLKDGALVLFEGQLGTIQSKRADRFSELTAWFNPIKVNGADMERAKTIFLCERLILNFPLSRASKEPSNLCSVNG